MHARVYGRKDAISKVCSGLLFLSRDYVDLNKANMEVAEQRGTDENENSSDRADVHHEACKAGDDFWDTPASPGCPASLASSTMEQHIQIDSQAKTSKHFMSHDATRRSKRPKTAFSSDQRSNHQPHSSNDLNDDDYFPDETWMEVRERETHPDPSNFIIGTC